MHAQAGRVGGTGAYGAARVEPCVRAMIDNLPILQGRSRHRSPCRQDCLRGAGARGRRRAWVHGGTLEAFMAHAAIQTFMAQPRGGDCSIDVCLGGPFGALTLLMVASGTGQLACVQVLLEAGVDVNKHVDDEGSPMIKGQPAMNLSATVRAGTTALAIACGMAAPSGSKLLPARSSQGLGKRPLQDGGLLRHDGRAPQLSQGAGRCRAKLPDIGRGATLRQRTGIARTGLIGTAVMHGEADCLAYLLELLNDVRRRSRRPTTTA